MASLSGEKTLAELSAEFGVHPTMISNWKQELVKRAGELFARGSKAPAVEDAQKVIDDLHRKIGQLQVERDFLAGQSRQNLSRFYLAWRCVTMLHSHSARPLPDLIPLLWRQQHHIFRQPNRARFRDLTLRKRRADLINRPMTMLLDRYPVLDRCITQRRSVAFHSCGARPYRPTSAIRSNRLGSLFLTLPTRVAHRPASHLF